MDNNRVASFTLNSSQEKHDRTSVVTVKFKNIGMGNALTVAYNKTGGTMHKSTKCLFLCENGKKCSKNATKEANVVLLGDIVMMANIPCCKEHHELHEATQ